MKHIRLQAFRRRLHYYLGSKRIVLILINLVILTFIVQKMIVSQANIVTEAQSKEVVEFTETALKNFDGTNKTGPVYLALDGQVYDVSSGRKFYQPGGPYHFLAGRDASLDLHILGAEIIKRKYLVIGRLTPAL
ncbi:MAG: cytochrome b5 domain-containing protein [Patescibacteria group bacterium]